MQARVLQKQGNIKARFQKKSTPEEWFSLSSSHTCQQADFRLELRYRKVVKRNEDHVFQRENK